VNYLEVLIIAQQMILHGYLQQQGIFAGNSFLFSGHSISCRPTGGYEKFISMHVFIYQHGKNKMYLASEKEG